MCSYKHSSMSKRMETFTCLMESARHRDMEFQKNKLDILMSQSDKSPRGFWPNRK